MADPREVYTEHDAQIWREELDDFVPSRVFDAHIHLFHPDHVDPITRHGVWSYADMTTLQGWAEQLYPGRETHFLILGTPIRGIDVNAHNQWAVEQSHTDPQSRMHRLVTPACQVDDIRRDVERFGFVGLKPYRVFSVTGDIAQCRIHEFLTHPQLELANEMGLWVTMHLSRHHGCADEHNLKDLHEFTTQRYPNIRWILAHCARSFTYWPIRNAIDYLKALPNIWYDVSAVTDVRPLTTLFQEEDTRRIFYGSDGVDSTYFHGQYTAFGRAWQAVDAERMQLAFPHCDSQPILAVYEQLLAMKHAAEYAGLSQEQVESIFWRNATREFAVSFQDEASNTTEASGS